MHKKSKYYDWHYVYIKVNGYFILWINTTFISMEEHLYQILKIDYYTNLELIHNLEVIFLKNLSQQFFLKDF